MSSPIPIPARTSPPAALDEAHESVHIAAPFAEAANDQDFYRNPLWLIVIGSACLFGAMALLLAFD